MIENYLLEELVTFQRMGTLQKTAAHLAVTQPTVTRGMQKLEDELGVKLFDRHPNRLELTAADPSYHPVPANNRVERSIKGLKAELTIYVTVKRQRQNQVQPLVDRLKAAWAKLPTTPTTGGTNVLK